MIAYAPMSNALVEMMVRTIDGAIGKKVHRRPSGWCLLVLRVL